jgi:hypothetical protein
MDIVQHFLFIASFDFIQRVLSIIHYFKHWLSATDWIFLLMTVMRVSAITCFIISLNLSTTAFTLKRRHFLPSQRWNKYWCINRFHSISQLIFIPYTFCEVKIGRQNCDNSKYLASKTEKLKNTTCDIIIILGVWGYRGVCYGRVC